MKPHLITTAEYNEINNNPLQLHAWAVRDLLEEKVRLYQFGKVKKPTKENLISEFKKLYSESLQQNKSWLVMGLCNALQSKEGNYSKGEPIYKLKYTIDCNIEIEKILNC